MSEQYVESIVIWRPPVDIGTGPLLVEDVDVDAEFELEATVKLTQIKKSIKNAVHNQHEYCFTISNIKKLKKQGE